MREDAVAAVLDHPEFQERAMVALRPGGKHIVLPGTGLRGRAALAAQAGPDGRHYAAFRDATMRFARLLRPLWDGTLADPRAARPQVAGASSILRACLASVSAISRPC